MRTLLLTTLLGLLAAGTAAEDGAALEAYRRLPVCALAPDGKRLLVEPCRRPPTKSPAQRRAVPSPPVVVAPLARPAPGPAVSPAPAPWIPPPGVQPLNNCDMLGCRDAGGTPYRSGAGNIVLDPSGRMCSRQGAWVQC
ncbi:hypothetical protein [Pseudoduganella namucuonensis]|uniref:Uncharacterized protein n=1 Tax=Pseudoduganella namucuonensis TaxID=1035707 RepID=A0A1I7I2P4_9BURK|nr:hypothetical protein [Pseudoduganella namucuonensis]SFU67046.1 hypothetical protein SAMN05216552_100740 [Pseudoduganella namucuonensis]